MDAMRRIVRLRLDGTYELDLTYFRHHQERISYQWTDGSPEFADLFAPTLESLLGPRRAPHDPLEDRHRDIARSVQGMYEEAFFNLIGRLSWAHGPYARWWLRHELGRQRQGAADDAVPAGLRAVSRG
jgi:carbamoyltransferase